MADLPKLTVQTVPMGRLERAQVFKIGDVKLSDVDHHVAHTDAGKAACGAVFFGGERIGTVIYLFSDDEGETVFTVDALYLEPRGLRSYLPDFVEWAERFALKSGATRARFMTVRGGLEKQMSERGYSRRVMLEKHL